MANSTRNLAWTKYFLLRHITAFLHLRTLDSISAILNGEITNKKQKGKKRYYRTFHQIDISIIYRYIYLFGAYLDDLFLPNKF